MNTNELIAELKRLDPTGTADVEIAVKTHTRLYPSAYVGVQTVSTSPWVGRDNHGAIRLWVSLPDGMTTMQRKQAA